MTCATLATWYFALQPLHPNNNLSTMVALSTLATASISTVLLALAVATFYLNSLAFTTVGSWLSPGIMFWYGPPSVNRTELFDADNPFTYFGSHKITLSYDWSTESAIWVAAAFTLMAALVGIASFAASLVAARKVRIPILHPLL